MKEYYMSLVDTPYVLLILIPLYGIMILLLKDYLRKMDEILRGKPRR